MNARQRNPLAGVIAIVLLLIAVLLPWIIASTAAPLQPPELAETVTAYFPTEFAYLTQDALLEFSATSVMSTLPPEFEDENGDEDASAGTFLLVSAPAQVDSNSLTVTALAQTIEALEGGVAPLELTMTAQMATIAALQNPDVSPSSGLIVADDDAPLTGTATAPINLYTCPSDSAQQTETLTVGAVFPIYGYSIDFMSDDEAVYFLIAHHSVTDQRWVKFDERSITLSADYTTVFDRGLACGSAPSIGGTRLEITPPIIATATDLPPVLETLIVTEADAQAQLTRDVPELREPTIDITSDNIVITGIIDLQLPLGARLAGDVTIIGALVQDGTALRFEVESVVAAGRDVTNDEEGQQVENAVNQWLVQLLIARDVISFTQTDDTLTVGTLRYFSARPTLNASDVPTITPQVGTVVPTRPLTVVTATPINTTATPLPIRNATATPEGTPAAVRADTPRVTAAQATNSAQQGLSLLGSPNISFDNGQIRINASSLTQGLGGVLGGALGGGGAVEIVGSLINNGGRLALDNPQLVIGGARLDIGGIPGLEQAINQWLGGLVPDVGMGIPLAEDGVLTILGG